jgi:hypothetical protein
MHRAVPDVIYVGARGDRWKAFEYDIRRVTGDVNQRIFYDSFGERFSIRLLRQYFALTARLPPTRSTSMKTNAFRFAVGVALFDFAAVSPACAQFSGNYPIIIVPPPAQNYIAPKPASKPPPDKPKPTDTPVQAAPAPTGRYQGRAYAPD